MTKSIIASKQNGIIALVSVLIITSVILIYGLSIALMNADEVVSGAVRLSGNKAGNLTASCVSNALARLRKDNSVSGNVNLAVANVNCTAIIAGSGNTRTINASATTTNPLSGSIVGRTNTNVNIDTNPFTIIQYNDILE
jgi:hypothetical protein